MNHLRRLLPYVRPYRTVVVWLVLTTVLPVIMELIVPRALAFVIDAGINGNDMGVIWRGSLIMLAAALMGALATLGQGYCRAILSQGLAFDMRNSLFAHVQSFSFANLDHMQTGQLMTRLSSDVDQVRMFTSHGISLMLRALLMITGSVVMLLLIDWQLALIMVGLLPVAGVIIWGLFRAARPLFLVVQQKLATLNTMVQENLAGVEVVKAFVRERYEVDRFDAFNADLRDQHIRVGKILAVAPPALSILTNVGIVLIIWLGGLSVAGGRISVGQLVAFNSYLMIGMAPLLLLSNMLTMVSQAEASAQRLLEVQDTQPAIPVDAAPVDRPMTGRVAFEDVRFSYADKEGETGRAVLDGVSFAVEAGQQVALLGATGSGKSTLVNMIPRFYDATGGRILVDGVDVRRWAPNALRRQVGTVLQQTTLFSGTVRENIAYGRPEASLEEVMAAAKAAQAHDFIMQMPGGYDGFVEARGANLSGGQKQRIAIARALLIDPAILILDDSTSAVDLETEFRIQQALDAFARAPSQAPPARVNGEGPGSATAAAGPAGRTTVVVAQRINSVLQADQILVLSQGQIVASGTHAELLRTSPIYREIYDSQLGG